jgi:hypothetical protein
MKNRLSREVIEILSTISKGRHRTNFLKNPEQKFIAFLVKRIPSFITSDMLTFLGLFGSLTTMISFILADTTDRNFLLLGVLGLAINWFGDSLDGRLAYYRNKPRKWYGFSLDITIDWISTVLIGTGFVIYAEGIAKWLGAGFVVMYGWAMITTLLQFKITDKYSIDTGKIGPTEVRVYISLMLLAEVILKNSIIYTTAFICAVSLVVNIVSTKELLDQANNRDNTENEKKLNPKV